MAMATAAVVRLIRSLALARHSIDATQSKAR
jgi:hypothetical protein